MSYNFPSGKYFALGKKEVQAKKGVREVDTVLATVIMDAVPVTFHAVCCVLT